MNATILPQQEHDRFDAFVAAQTTGAVTQSCAWGRFREAAGLGKFWPVAVYERGDIVGAALLISRPIPFGNMWLAAVHGPVVHNTYAQGGMVLDALLDAMARIAKEYCAIFARIEPKFFNNDGMWRSFVGRHSFVAAPERQSPEHTLRVLLAPSEETILAQMKPKGRYNIGLAERKGVRVRQGNREDVAVFFQLLEATARRDHFSIHAQKTYEQFLAMVPSALFVAELASVPLAAIVVTFFGNEATYYYGASSSEQRETMAPYLLHWEAMREAKRRGCTTYDFFGVAPEGDAHHSWAKLTQFKERFGGTRVAYESARELVLRPWWYRVFRLAKRFCR